MKILINNFTAKSLRRKVFVFFICIFFFASLRLCWKKYYLSENKKSPKLLLKLQEIFYKILNNLMLEQGME